MNAEALTERERVIVAMRVNYRTQTEIADKLCLSVKTVDTHLRNAREKFNALTVGELCRRARLQGIIESNDIA